MNHHLGKPRAPKRGQGAGEVLHSAPSVDEPIHVCIDKVVSDDLLPLSAELAIEENMENMPLIPFGADISNPNKMALLTGKKWQNGRVIKVFFMEGDRTVQDKVLLWAKKWEEHANIKLEVVSNRNESDVRISFNPNSGSWSYIGTDCLTVSKDEPTINFGWLAPDTPDEDYSRVVLHEIGHMLGCIHEHQHPEQGIPWNKDAVYAYYMGPPNNWSKAEVDSNIFKKYKNNLTQFSAWDKSSIMSYAVPKKLTTDGFSIGWNSTLSTTDKEFISRMYPKASPEKKKAFIERLFQVVLLRDGTEEEVQQHLALLDKRSRLEVVTSVERSRENTDQFTNYYYSRCLERKPTKQEEEEVADMFKRQITEELVAAHLCSKILVNDDKDFVTWAFNVLMERDATEYERSHWHLNLSLFGRPVVCGQIAQLRDRKVIHIGHYYLDILNRNPTHLELNGWANSSLDLAKIRFALLNSEEFFLR